MSDKYSVSIVVPMVPPSHNVLRRKYRSPHAYKDLRNSWQRTLHALIQRGDRTFLMRACEAKRKMRIEIEIRHWKQYDPDNVDGGVKPAVDSLRNLGFLHDDSSEFLELIVRQEKLRMDETSIKICEAL